MGPSTIEDLPSGRQQRNILDRIGLRLSASVRESDELEALGDYNFPECAQLEYAYLEAHIFDYSQLSVVL